MTWSSTGTQTGTDTNLSTITSVTGVTVNVSASGHRTYQVPTTVALLTIQGNLSWDSDYETLELSESTRVEQNSNVTVEIGKLTTINGKPRYSKGVGLIMNRQQGSPFINTSSCNWWVKAHTSLVTSGKFIVNGSRIMSGGGIFLGNSTTPTNNFVTFTLNGGAVLQNISTTQNMQMVRAFCEPSGININQGTIDGRTIGGIPFSNAGWGTLNLSLDFGNFQCDGNGAAAPVTVANATLANNVNTFDYAYVANSNDKTKLNKYIFESSDVGTDLRTAGQTGTAWRLGVVELIKPVVFKVQDSTGSAIENCVTYMKLNAASINPSTGSRYAGIDDYLTPRVYIGTTAATGLTTSQSVLFGVAQGYDTDGTLAGQALTMDRLTSRTGDIHDGYMWSYDHLVGQPSAAMRGTGTLTQSWTLFNDTNKTLSRTAAIAKLASSFAVDRTNNKLTWSQASTLDDEYDATKAYKCSSVQAQVEYPTIDTQIINVSGTYTSTNLLRLINAPMTQGTKFKDMTGSKQVEVNGASASATFNRGTITWSPSDYLSQWFIQNGATFTLTNSSLFTVNAQAALGYNTKTMFGTNSTLNLNASTMVFNAQSGATSYNGSVFSAFQANGTATMNITNGTWTINGPTAGSTYVIHTYWSAASAINGFTINGTAASAVALEMGATNQKLTGLSHAGQFNGSSNGTNKQFYVHNDALVYTGSTSPLNTSTARLVKWVWLDPVRSDGALFRWAVGTQGATGASGQFGVLYFRPTISIEKVGYAPKMRLTPSALSSRYPSKTVQTTALTAVALSNFYTDSGFTVNDGALPFVDSLDDKTVINTIDWVLDFRQNGWLGQTASFTAANAKKGLITYSASGAVDSNYINDTTGAADALLITVNETTRVLAAASGTLTWSAQRMYNALINKWSSFVIEQNIAANSTGGTLDLSDFTVDVSISFIRGVTTDLLSQVRTSGIIQSQANEIPVADVNGSRASISGLDPQAFGVTWFLRWKKTSASTWTTSSGTGNNTQIVVDQDSYTVQARVPGYDWKTVAFDTTLSLSLDLNLQYQVSANNTPQYTMPFDSALEAIFQYNAVAMKVSVDNTTSGILQPGFAELYRATQRIQHISALVWSWTAPVTANATSQKILIPTGNPISMFLTDGSTNTVKITCPVIHADTGNSADDRVRGNASGYSIILGSPATAESAGLQAGIVAALGGANYDESTASLVVLKDLLSAVQTLNTAIKGKTDNLPAQPAAVGDAMTLTSAYDAAKTASTQSSVDALSTDLTSIKGTGYDSTKHNLVKIKQQASLAAALSA